MLYLIVKIFLLILLINPIGLNINIDKIPFHPYFSIKDTVGFILAINLLF